MPSPFPGMNSYLERANIWEDFHQSLGVDVLAWHPASLVG